MFLSKYIFYFGRLPLWSIMFYFSFLFWLFLFPCTKGKLLIYFAKKKRNFWKFNIYGIHFKIKFNTDKCSILKWKLAQWLSNCFCLLHWRNNGTNDFKRPLTQCQIQYLLWPPLTCRTVRTHLHIDSISRWILTFEILYHSYWSDCCSTWKVSGCGWRWRRRRSNSSHRCSIGFKSGDFKGHWIIVMLWFCR